MDLFLWEQLPEDSKEAPQGLKPEEELAKFTVDEHLSEVEKATLFLTGQPVQQRKAIDNLPAVIRSRGRSGFEAIHHHLLAALAKLDADAQIATAEAFAAVVRERLLPSADLADCLLPLVLDAIKKERSEEESEAWQLALSDMVPLLSREVLLGKVLPLALSKGEVKEGVSSRVTCCRLLGAVAPHLHKDDVKSRFFSKAMALCQDTDYQVRIAMCGQLAVLAQSVSQDLASGALMDELKELLRDEEVQVRVTALGSLVRLVDALSADARRSSALPLIRAHMQPLDLELPVQRALAALFTAALQAVRADLCPDDTSLFYGCFRHLAARSDPDLRRTCATALPEVMRYCLPGTAPSYFFDTFLDLAADHDESVRVAVAGQLSAVAVLMGPADAGRLLRKPLVALLRDDVADVRAALLPGLGATLQAFVGMDEYLKDAVAVDIHAALLVLQGRVGRDWRSQRHLANAFPSFVQLFGSDLVHDNWLPLAFELATHGCQRVKPAAADGIAAFFRRCRTERQRSDTYGRICRELGRGRSCWQRMAFVDVCTAVLRRFSCRFFKEYLLDLAMELLVDPTPNVRLHVTPLLPALKQTIRLPEDVEQLELLNSAMSNLMTDPDRDVSHAARGAHDAFKRTQVRMSGGGPSAMDHSSNGTSSSSSTGGLRDRADCRSEGGFGVQGSRSSGGGGSSGEDFEADDRWKESQEGDFTFSAEELDRLRADLCLGSPGRHNGRGRLGNNVTSTSSSSAEVAKKSSFKRGDSSHKAEPHTGSTGATSGVPRPGIPSGRSASAAPIVGRGTNSSSSHSTSATPATAAASRINMAPRLSSSGTSSSGMGPRPPPSGGAPAISGLSLGSPTSSTSPTSPSHRAGAIPLAGSPKGTAATGVTGRSAVGVTGLGPSSNRPVGSAGSLSAAAASSNRPPASAGALSAAAASRPIGGTTAGAKSAGALGSSPASKAGGTGGLKASSSTSSSSTGTGAGASRLVTSSAAPAAARKFKG